MQSSRNLEKQCAEIKVVAEDHVPAPSTMALLLYKMEFEWEKMVGSRSNLNRWKNSQKMSKIIQPQITEIILNIFYAATKYFY
ncbi:hypothetical protein TSUD_175460 [Trifolium subterraneum]|uniref:Uncharacterized protein n=1 Tax=Trifolium subterraneum TaxID=3900 RepID=A0A2Z6NTW7_TRISU|nr:hypothetical protein TSUD_175460 [Trifolium subterraneum]